MRFQHLINVSCAALSLYVALIANAAEPSAKIKPTKAQTPEPIQMATIPPRATTTPVASVAPTTAAPASRPAGSIQIVVPTIPPVSSPKPTATAAPSPLPTPSAEPASKIKGPRIGFKINLNLTRGAATTTIRTNVNLVKGESVVIGGLLRTVCKDDVCSADKEKNCPQKCETLHEDIKFTLSDFKNDVIHSRFDVVGPQATDHVGFVVTGKIYTTISFSLHGDLKVKLLLTPAPL